MVDGRQVHKGEVLVLIYALYPLAMVIEIKPSIAVEAQLILSRAAEQDLVFRMRVIGFDPCGERESLVLEGRMQRIQSQVALRCTGQPYALGVNSGVGCLQPDDGLLHRLTVPVFDL